MSWLDRLFRRLPRIWSRDPLGISCFSLSYAGGSAAWVIADDVLTVSIDGTALVFTFPFSSYPTCAQLAAALTASGLTVHNLGVPLALISPLALAEGAGDTSSSAGSVIYQATAPQYMTLRGIAAELATAEAQIPLLPLEMSTTTATGSWLDVLGGYFNVPRITVNGVSEADAVYAVRIIAETIRPKCNNKAMEAALLDYTGLAATVVDVFNGPGQNFCNGAFTCNGSVLCNGVGTAPVGGLFDVYAGYNGLDENTLPGISAVLTGYINRLRAAGTQLRNLILNPLNGLTDTAPVPSDLQDSLSVTTDYLCNGVRKCDGSFACSGVGTTTGTLEGTLQ